MFTLLVYLAITSFCFLFVCFSLWMKKKVYGAFFAWKLQFVVLWAKTTVFINFGLYGQKKYDRVSDCIHTKLWTFLPFFQCVFFSFVVHLQKVCVNKQKRKKNPPNRNTLCLKKFELELFFLKQNCAESEKQCYFKCRLTQVLMPLWELLVRHYEFTHQRIPIYIWTCLNEITTQSCRIQCYFLFYVGSILWYKCT